MKRCGFRHLLAQYFLWDNLCSGVWRGSEGGKGTEGLWGLELSTGMEQ